MDNMPKILFVDDELPALNALRRVLNKGNFKVLSTTNPDEALTILKTNKVDMIICDHQMPALFGIEVLKQARDLAPDAVRILITGSSDLSMAIQALREGIIYHYFAKPWENNELAEIVHKGLKEKNLKGVVQ